MQTKPQWDIAYKNGKHEEKVFAGRNVEGIVPVEKSMAGSYKTQHAPSTWLCDRTIRYFI